MAGYDLQQALLDSHNADCRCRSCVPTIISRRCRICGAEFEVPIGRGMREAGTALLSDHLETHTRSSIVRVYALGEPWHVVVADEAC